jgi:hypothetical protein
MNWQVADLSNQVLAQLSAAMTQQREAIFQEVNAVSGQVHDVLADTRNSIIVARDAAASINENTARTIAVTEAASRHILNEAIFGAILLIVIGVFWPALVLFAYRYAKRRYLDPPR